VNTSLLQLDQLLDSKSSNVTSEITQKATNEMGEEFASGVSVEMQPLGLDDLPAEIAKELEQEIPDKTKLVVWVKDIFERKTGEKHTNEVAFREWLSFQFENSEVPIFYRKYPMLQSVVSIDMSSKINSISHRHCRTCNPTNPTQSAFPIFNFTLRIRGRSRQSISSADFSAYQLAIRSHLTSNNMSFKKFSAYCLALTFVLKSSQKDQDIDNMSKTMMDAVSRALGFDDAKVSHLDAIKLRLPDTEEYVRLRLGPSYVDTIHHDDIAINELQQYFSCGPKLL
jgi:Holliday junction resolvase RusA-like endonuclease